MKSTPFSCAPLLLACLSAALPAQDQATALAQLARAADVVVVATVDAVQQQPEWLRTQFQRGQVLKGSVGASFSLLEPAGRCCGNSLFALGLGDQRLLFLRRTGALLHPLGGARGVLPAAPAVVQHTAALLAAGADDAALAHLLAAALDHDEPRIAEDAAHALLALPQLPLTAAERQKVHDQLATALQQGRTRAATLAELTARTADDAAVDTLLPMYLDAARPDQARLLRRALERCPTQLVTERLSQFLDRGRARDLRAATLLAGIDAPTATARMQQMLRRPCHPEVQLQLCEGLLQKGERDAALAPLVPAPVLQLAHRRRDGAKKFRNIDPRR
ncbi:MAG: hypothetical protein H6835_06620 [Planctomycetes bacterium]|nr:hypothetical protein [Planctomycetota bacterium]